MSFSEAVRFALVSWSELSYDSYVFIFYRTHDQVHVNKNTPSQRSDFFVIPDLIKKLPSFDGNKKQPLAWISKVETTLNIFRPIVFFFFYGSTTVVGQGLPVPTCGLGFQ